MNIFERRIQKALRTNLRPLIVDETVKKNIKEYPYLYGGAVRVSLGKVLTNEELNIRKERILSVQLP